MRLSEARSSCQHLSLLKQRDSHGNSTQTTPCQEVFTLHTTLDHGNNETGIISQPCNDSFDLRGGVEVVVGCNLRNINVVWGHLF
jgi:hypothetical protein